MPDIRSRIDHCAWRCRARKVDCMWQDVAPCCAMSVGGLAGIRGEPLRKALTAKDFARRGRGWEWIRDRARHSPIYQSALDKPASVIDLVKNKRLFYMCDCACQDQAADRPIKRGPK